MTKKKVKNKAPSQKWKKYEIKEGKVERKQSCPKCGAGIFLAQHKDRSVCGKCGYTIFNKKE